MILSICCFSMFHGIRLLSTAIESRTKAPKELATLERWGKMQGLGGCMLRYSQLYVTIPWRIHGAGIYANIGGILMVNVTIYSSTMDPMGYWVVIKTLPTSIFRGLHMAPHGSTSCQSDIALFKVHTGVLGDMWKAPPKAAVEALFEAWNTLKYQLLECFTWV